MRAPRQFLQYRLQIFKKGKNLHNKSKKCTLLELCLSPALNTEDYA